MIILTVGIPSFKPVITNPCKQQTNKKIEMVTNPLLDDYSEHDSFIQSIAHLANAY